MHMNAKYPGGNQKRIFGTILSINIQTCIDIPNPNVFSPSTSTVTKCQGNTCHKISTSDQPSDLLHSSEQHGEEPRITGQNQKQAEKQARVKLKCMTTKRPMKKYLRRGLQLKRPMLIYVVFAFKQ